MRRWLAGAGVAAVAVMAFGGCAGQPAPTGFTVSDDAGTAPPSADGAVSVDGKQPCVHNDDCTGPNLCQGNNGLQCLGGFCVPTGRPMSCDDGVSCTEDVCDATQNKCVHKPNDAACPNQSYCDPTLSCVQSLPCTPGDSVCDRLNTSACDGLWSCDGARKLCVKAAKPCADRPNATTTCTPSGSQTTCAWTCNASYADVNGDLNVAPPAVSNGCECQITNANDKPDLAFADTNCDGIDGTAANAIFVDGVTGNDANAGTRTSPKKTIMGGVGAATAQTPNKDVYVSKGTYNEAVVLADGVSLYGGYDAAAGWSRAVSNVTTISSPGAVAVLAQNLTKATEIQLFTIVAQNATGTTSSGDGRSSIGVRVLGSTGTVTVRGCTITAGAGSAGMPGAKGATGTAGGKGGDASGTTQGGPGASACGAPGGQGGAGVSGATQGNAGSPGTQAPGGGTPAAGGNPGAAGSCSTTSSDNGGAAPPVASPGGQGGPGANGSPGANFGTLDFLGEYVAPAGGDGLTSGYPGGGGGGGGSGGGSAHGTNFLCTNCSSIWSGGGGGGGGGGCGGAPGSGGRGGGGSFAIAIVSSSVVVEATKMTTSNGGNGGAGGDGGDGGSGGPVGAGAGGQVASNGCSTRSGGSGAWGSAGGPGGRGGGASGGTGGPSVCIIYKGGAPTTQGTQCTNGGGGVGGNGGSNGLQAAPKGTDGVVGDIRSAL
jgi:hypothetical protein